MRESSLEEGVRHKQEKAEDSRRRQLRLGHVEKPKFDPDPYPDPEPEPELESEPDPE